MSPPHSILPAPPAVPTEPRPASRPPPPESAFDRVFDRALGRRRTPEASGSSADDSSRTDALAARKPSEGRPAEPADTTSPDSPSAPAGNEHAGESENPTGTGAGQPSANSEPADPSAAPAPAAAPPSDSAPAAPATPLASTTAPSMTSAPPPPMPAPIIVVDFTQPAPSAAPAWGGLNGDAAPGPGTSGAATGPAGAANPAGGPASSTAPSAGSTGTAWPSHNGVRRASRGRRAARHQPVPANVISLAAHQPPSNKIVALPVAPPPPANGSEARVLSDASSPASAGPASGTRVVAVQFRGPGVTRPVAPEATELPAGAANGEKISAPTALPPGAKVISLAAARAKITVGTGAESASSAQDQPPGTAAGTAGTSAAKPQTDMERFGQSNAALLAGTADTTAPGQPDAAARAAGAPTDSAARHPATDWPAERMVGASDRPAPEGPGLRPALGPAPAETVERLSRLMSEEAALVRRHQSDSLSVVLRPDPGTELYVHLSRKDGQVEAVVRCERGDFVQLHGLWSQLQESLARQQVRLAPLQEGNFYDGYKPAETAANITGGEPDLSRRPAPDGGRNDSLDPRPVPAPPTQASESTTRRSGPRQSTSRPGWESWA